MSGGVANKLHVIKDRTNKPIKERFINMSTALVRSAQGVSLAEKRILMLALAHTDSKSSKDAVMAQFAGGFVVRIVAQEYAEVYQLDTDTAYRQMQTAAKDLMKRQVKTLENTRRGVVEVRTNWCGQSKYHQGEGWLEVAFTAQISPHLLGLRKAFTQIQLKQASTLRSLYSVRLLDNLCGVKQKGVWSPSVVDFNRIMEVPPSLVKDFGQVRRRVIEPAIKELKDKSNVLIEYELFKSGRKIIEIHFKLKKNPQEAMFTDDSAAEKF